MIFIKHTKKICVSYSQGVKITAVCIALCLTVALYNRAVRIHEEDVEEGRGVHSWRWWKMSTADLSVCKACQQQRVEEILT